jgi:lipopolysaccharide/colanic/teichoic acid biosynthesis glycosyltransferase
LAFAQVEESSVNNRTVGQREAYLADALPLPLEYGDESVERFEQRASERTPVRVPHRDPFPRSLPGTEEVSRDLDVWIRGSESLEPDWHGLSRWSRSSAKRFFDCACVVLSMPLLIPVMLLVGAAVRLTSSGPVLFLQNRMGRHGRIFKIVKFRTMEHLRDERHHPVTTTDNQRFTAVGPFLRRWKLDELPQVVNVLLGHMSLIGPRPKLPEHVISDLPCRPGVSGMATVVFASEEAMLARVPKAQLNAYYHSFVLPMKQQLDADYMARATFLSDLRLIVNSALRRWDKTDFVVAAPEPATAGEGRSGVSNRDGLTPAFRTKRPASSWGFAAPLADQITPLNPPQ